MINFQPFFVVHINFSGCDRAGHFGKGWRFSLMQELKATGDTDFPYVLIDADGTSHYFYKDEDDNK